ncbi:ABC transporter permease [Phytobacter diazotrophicus]|uniref:Transport permease protein n=2 Tax=Enterobacteriaceae TaxID=543 RepID=A0ABM7VQ87_9ENTR|nr:transport permease protein [Phytobacter diazotrophicus]BEG80244.1 ABC transporter permease [Phytobacter diazotrophicus]BEG86044.1 ABC transporter permease [Phytobacter diazotrophicus]BEG91841.1 ABC transporter permease [Phytobacter diazotrophicus]SLK03366.1 capsular polysaccharide transport system permease protein [Enterobacter sp. NFR05]
MLVAKARGGSVSHDMKVASLMVRSGLEVQQAAVKALFLREIKTRFGKYRLGYFWAVLEPAAHLLVLMVIFGFIMHRTMPDISFPVFLLNGIIPYFIFTNITNRSIGAIEANLGLFNYRPVKPIDTIIARASLETLIYAAVYLILMAIVWVLGEEYSVTNILILVFSWFLLIIFSCGLGLVFMVLGKTFPELAKFLPIVLKPLYFISCIMFPIHSVPKEYWHYLLWNPIVHAIELSRESVVAGYLTDGVSLGYLALSAIIMLFIGLALYRTREEAMLTS